MIRTGSFRSWMAAAMVCLSEVPTVLADSFGITSSGNFSSRVQAGAPDPPVLSSYSAQDSLASLYGGTEVTGKVRIRFLLHRDAATDGGNYRRVHFIGALWTRTKAKFGAFSSRY